MSSLALLGGKKSKSKPFPTWPQFDDTERRGLTEVLESGVWWRTPGTKTLEFEGAFARFHGARHGLAVTNGTGATVLGGPFGGCNIQALPTITIVLNNTTVQSTVAVETPVMGGANDTVLIMSI